MKSGWRWVIGVGSVLALCPALFLMMDPRDHLEVTRKLGTVRMGMKRSDLIEFVGPSQRSYASLSEAKASEPDITVDKVPPGEVFVYTVDECRYWEDCPSRPFVVVIDHDRVVYVEEPPIGFEPLTRRHRLRSVHSFQ